MNTIDIGATKYTFGLKVGTVTLDPTIIWGQFHKNVTGFDYTFDFNFTV